jgi:hypothetical protein
VFQLEKGKLKICKPLFRIVVVRTRTNFHAFLRIDSGLSTNNDEVNFSFVPCDCTYHFFVTINFYYLLFIYFSRNINFFNKYITP